MKAVLCLIVSLMAIGCGRCAEVNLARAYFMDWDVETVSSLSIPRLRSQAEATIEISAGAEIDAFLDVLRLQDLRVVDSSDAYLENVRLVVDLVRADGSVETFYASRFHLCSSDSKRKRVIDAVFRDVVRSRFKRESSKTANQSSEPTPTAGTSAAEQPLVPAAVVAHL